MALFLIGDGFPIHHRYASIKGLFSDINTYSIWVFKGQSVVENSKAERIAKSKSLYSMALAQAFARYPDENNVEIVHEPGSKRSYVRATKHHPAGSLILVPCGPLVKARLVQFGDKVGELESFVMNTEQGERIMCSPIHKPFNEATVSISPR